MGKWIQVDDNEWVHSPTGSHIEIVSTFDESKVILDFGGYSKTLRFESYSIAKIFIQNIINDSEKGLIEWHRDYQLKNPTNPSRIPRVIKELFNL